MRGLDAGDHLAGVEPDPQPERRAAAPLVVEHPADRPLHGQRGPDRPFGVVLVRHRGAEDRHDPVAGELVDVPAEGLHRAGERGEHPVGDRADPFRVEVLRPGGEVGQVAEEHGDDPALGRRQRGGGRQRGAAVVAEPRAGNGDGSAHRAGHSASNPLAPGCGFPGVDAQIVQLGADRPLGRPPERAVDVGVDRRHHLGGRVGAGRDRRPDLVEPGPAVGQVELGGGGAVGQRRAVPGQRRDPAGTRTSSSRLLR